MIKRREGIPDEEKDMFKGKVTRTSVESSEKYIYSGISGILRGHERVMSSKAGEESSGQMIKCFICHG